MADIEINLLSIKLASIAVHADEFISPDGNEFDAAAIKGLLQDPDVKEFLAELDGMALLPVKRQ